MAGIIGHILPLALGVALSSVPIVVMVLILLSPRGRWSGLAYLIGAVVGLAGLTGLFTAIASLIPPVPGSDHSPLIAVIEWVVGAGLIVMAVIRLVRSRRKARSSTDGLELFDDEVPATTPAWMTRLTRLGPLPSLGVGFVLMLRPKNLLLTIAAGVAIATGDASFAETVVAVVIFVVLGISTLAAPIIFALADPARTAKPLEETRVWITRNSATVTTIVLLVLGTVVIGSGLTHF
ncbi:GAP family protein [Herbiconiux sp. KACC 21604]|uniref:GAP family protein n=1 Tax=unclassified Herbiconiux TaxID=2618217 RepID=UPI0014908FCF|nr:GAP family protein [Herbiconiux sp. SALV-R1]QJU53892.1 GAP family protein [Herbiconiux sp. SALV-R1]WPO84909.1 GAP family protein [Herbiconiux sp. KACC 21604]